MSKPNVGLQLYTVREDCARDLAGTIRAVAGMGYGGVEFAWEYGGLSPSELADLLNQEGLLACGWHAQIDDLLNPDSDVYRYVLAIGSPYVTVSLCSEVADRWDEAIEKVARAGEAAKSCGVTLSYHNHGGEFELINGQYALDLLYARTDAETVRAQIDTHYVRKMGVDPAEYIRKYAGRTKQVHLKDLHRDGTGQTEVGTGIVDIRGVLNTAVETGVEWVIIEQESDFHDGSALFSAELSINNLKQCKVICDYSGIRNQRAGVRGDERCQLRASKS